MLLLLLFALLAGAGTAITPCVLPILPALLSSAATGGRRRPVGIVLGLTGAFTVAITAGAQFVNGVGAGPSSLRDLAVAVLMLFGVVMLVPAAAGRLQAPLSRLARFGPRTRGDGFFTGIGVGAALGFVCAPCAGPILATVIAVSASARGPSAAAVLTGLCYSAGLGAMMLLYGFGGRLMIGRIRRAARGHRVERAIGAVLILTGVAMAFNLDVRLDSFIARHQHSLPGFLFDPTQGVESSAAVQRPLGRLVPPSRYVSAAATATAPERARAVPPSVGLAGVRTPALKDLGAAPGFVDTEQWFNTPRGRPLTLAGLRGHVVLIDFWTYTCINCLRTLPFVEGLYAHYRRDGLVVVGVETPEFTFEQNPANVAQAVSQDRLTYPVVQDNRYGTWNAYGNQYWPAEYLIDAHGQVRHTQFGEGDYPGDEAAVRTLLYEAGARHLPAPMTAHAVDPSPALATPETYLDPQRAQGFLTPLRPGDHRYGGSSGPLALNRWALAGRWHVGAESIAPAGASATIQGTVQAAHVYLVMTSDANRARMGRVLLDGHAPTRSQRGVDVGPGGRFSVRGQRLYDLISLPRDARFTLTVALPPGVAAYDFTFG